jgi:hypothetical protein
LAVPGSVHVHLSRTVPLAVEEVGRRTDLLMMAASSELRLVTAVVEAEVAAVAKV